MGCCGSKEATDEEKQEICKQMAKEMMLISVNPALNNAGSIKVEMPDAFASLKKASAELKQQAADAKAKPAEAPAEEDGNKAEGNKAEGEKKGSMLGFLNKAADMAMSAIEKAAEMGAEGIAAGLNSMATLIDQTVQSVEDPMTDIGGDIIKAKTEAVAKVFSSHIVNAQVPGAVELCNPKGPKNAITEYLINKAMGNLKAQLKAAIDEALTDHKGIKAWGAAIDKYNQAVEKASGLKMPLSVPLKKIELDIKDHICEQVVLGIGKLMADEEAKNRDSPQGKTNNHAAVFVKVFTGEKLMYSDYKQVTAS